LRKQNYLWDKVAKAFHKTSSRSFAHSAKYEEVANIIFANKCQNVLDLGCGSGILEKVLIKRGFDGKIIAVDVSEPMLDIAEKLVISPNVKFIKGDLDSNFEDLIDGKFDAIIAINVFFFLEDKIAFLQKIPNKLKSRNSLFIMITARPIKESSMLTFVKEPLLGKNTFQKFRILLAELKNLPYYLQMARNQAKIDQMEKKGIIKCDNPEEIKKMLQHINLEIIDSKDVHAKQNWLIIFRRAE